MTEIVDAFASMMPEERAELEQELEEEGRRDFERGDHVDAREFVTQLAELGCELDIAAPYCDSLVR